jgi:hypothetical protein
MWLLGRLVPDHKTIPDFRMSGIAGERHGLPFLVLARQRGL